MPVPDEEPHISFTLREMFADLKAMIADVKAEVVGLKNAMSLKADRAEVLQLEQRLGHAEGRVTALEHLKDAADKHYQARVDHRRWLYPTIAAFLAALATLIAAFAAFHH